MNQDNDEGLKIEYISTTESKKLIDLTSSFEDDQVDEIPDADSMSPSEKRSLKNAFSEFSSPAATTVTTAASSTATNRSSSSSFRSPVARGSRASSTTTKNKKKKNGTRRSNNRSTIKRAKPNNQPTLTQIFNQPTRGSRTVYKTDRSNEWSKKPSPAEKQEMDSIQSFSSSNANDAYDDDVDDDVDEVVNDLATVHDPNAQYMVMVEEMEIANRDKLRSRTIECWTLCK